MKQDHARCPQLRLLPPIQHRPRRQTRSKPSSPAARGHAREPRRLLQVPPRDPPHAAAGARAPIGVYPALAAPPVPLLPSVRPAFASQGPRVPWHRPLQCASALILPRRLPQQSNRCRSSRCAGGVATARPIRSPRTTPPPPHVADVRALLQDEAVYEAAAAEAYPEYNKAHLVSLELPDRSGDETVAMHYSGSYGMLVPVRLSQYLDKTNEFITFPRVIWSSLRHLRTSSLTSTCRCSIFHRKSYAAWSM